MQTELGRVTHRYWWTNGIYFRHPIGNLCIVQRWDGAAWMLCTSVAVARLAA